MQKKQSRRDLLREIDTLKKANSEYLHALAALIVEKGEQRVRVETFALLDADMSVRKSVDEDRREIVFSLMIPQASVAHA